MQAATSNPAKFLGKDKELGSIEKGKLGDLVLLEADPLQDIKNTQKINAVVLGGELIPQSDTTEMLSRIETGAKDDRGGKLIGASCS